MNIEKTIEALTAIHGELKGAIQNRDHILEELEPGRDKTGAIKPGIVIPRNVPTGHLANASGAVQRAVENLKGFAEKITQVKASNEKLQPAKIATEEVTPANKAE